VKKMSDIPERYFKHLISRSQSIKESLSDLQNMHHINCKELEGVFYRQVELIMMKRNNETLTDEQWEKFWNIIVTGEMNHAKEKTECDKYDVECRIRDEEQPIQHDEDGYAYRWCIDYEGKSYRSYCDS